MDNHNFGSRRGSLPVRKEDNNTSTMKDAPIAGKTNKRNKNDIREIKSIK
jgi:hypothetical protein